MKKLGILTVIALLTSTISFAGKDSTVMSLRGECLIEVEFEGGGEVELNLDSRRIESCLNLAGRYVKDMDVEYLYVEFNTHGWNLNPEGKSFDATPSIEVPGLSRGECNIEFESREGHDFGIDIPDTSGERCLKNALQNARSNKANYLEIEFNSFR